MRSAAIGSYFVLALECLQRVNLIHTQRLEGSRFGAKSRHPRNIRHNAHPAETYEIRRLPGTSARVAALSAALGSRERKDRTGPDHTLGIKTSPWRPETFDDEDENDYESTIASPS